MNCLLSFLVPVTRVLFLAFAMAVASSAGAASPTKLIFDTDIGNDVDDVLALAMIHVLQDRGACELLGVTLTIPHKLAGNFTDAVNTFYGRPDIPIGINPDAPDGFFADKDFLKLAQQEKLYPSDLVPARTPRAVPLLRQLLAGAEDGSVVIVQVGFFTNMADLLDSKGDASSPLDGRALVARKVRLLSIMGGDFKNARAEYNVRFDIRAARAVAERWPTPIVWSGSEVGNAVTYPAQSIERDFGYTSHHIVRDAYQLYMPAPHERPCWDLTSVWYAIFPDAPFLAVSDAGTVSLTAKGISTYRPAPHGRDRILSITPPKAEELRQLFARLVSAPPAVR